LAALGAAAVVGAATIVTAPVRILAAPFYAPGPAYPAYYPPAPAYYAPPPSYYGPGLLRTLSGGNAATKVPPRRGGRPSRAAAALLGERILDAATELFLAEGYDGTSIEAVAQRARISKRTFYHRFPDKAALFGAVVHRIVEQLRPPAGTPLYEGGNLDVLRRLARLLLRAALMLMALSLNRLISNQALEKWPARVAPGRSAPPPSPDAGSPKRLDRLTDRLNPDPDCASVRRRCPPALSAGSTTREPLAVLLAGYRADAMLVISDLKVS
jgi:AcrR family transcriptional regulator